MNRKKKLLPLILTLTLLFTSCVINIYAHGETDTQAQQEPAQQTQETSTEPERVLQNSHHRSAWPGAGDSRQP
ncbi:MAG TPA: hypothetical protein DIV41_07790, partial [Ruminococcaceae bacterium]|nr:hypothetical protein [Oscillospiraceae bacterium]